MKNSIIKKIPVPIAGLMLALAAAGNLVSSYGMIYKNIFGSFSLIILVFLILKIGICKKEIIEDLKNPVVASVSPTFSMAVMILSTYIKPYLPSLAYNMWILGLLSNLGLIIYFTRKFIFNFDIKKVFPSYFVAYVGIVVASVTSPAYGLNNIGEIVFWFGFICYSILLPIVIYRIFVIKAIPEPALPTITIFAAPASLCLAGYLSSFQEKSIFIVYFLATLSLIMVTSVLIYMPRMLKLKFYPSYSAFTFPLVISAIAMKKLYSFLIGSGKTIMFLKYIAVFEELIAILIVIYVLIRYTVFIVKNTQGEKEPKSSVSLQNSSR